jgi:hypothetical protein
MKRFYYSLRSVLLLVSVFLLIQSFGQNNALRDAGSDLGHSYVTPPGGQHDPGTSRDACQYILDDGTIENAVGLTLGGDLMWLNYFTITGGCETINTVYLTWGLIPNGRPCRVILYEDPDDDGNPDDAIYLTETSTTVQNAWAFFNPGEVMTFTTVGITPTTVSGGFFVAALIQNQLGGEYPGPMDATTNQGKSWVAYSAGGTFDVDNLSSNTIYSMGDIGLGSNLMLRAEGGGAPADVPLSNWALFIGIGLILAFAVVRFRKMV